MLDPKRLEEDTKKRKDDSLRPQSWNEFVGQSELKEVLSISVKATLSRKEALDHVLFYGNLNSRFTMEAHI